MVWHVDNQPDYYTSRPPALKELTFDIVASGPRTVDEEDLCEPDHQTHYVQIKSLYPALDIRDVKQLLSRALTPARCHCAHDCCGHRHGYANVTLYDLETARIDVFTSRNY